MKSRSCPLLLALGVCALLGIVRPACGQEYHDNVVIVLDASGSMGDPLAGTGIRKMDAAKTALKTVLKQVPARTHIGLLVFSSANLKDHWAYPLGARDDAALTRAIDLPQPGRDTPLGRYLKIAADRLLEERAKQFSYGTYRLLIVTDGEAQDQNLVDRYTPEVMARGITLDVIGVGMNQAHTLARKAHSYRRANDPASLQRAVAEVLAEVSKPQSDTAGAEAFASIAPIPTEVAAAAIQALSTSGNQPIGIRSETAKPTPPAPPRTQPPAPPAAPVAPLASTPPRSLSPLARFIVTTVPGLLCSLGTIAVILFILVRLTKRGGHR